MGTMTDVLSHVSEKPWSEFTAADYTPAQWHRACLIHTHDGEATSKDQCKLPVKTPDGVVSKPGVYAAAAALAGARGGLNASSEQKSKAAKTLISYYRSFDQDPPESLLEHSGLAHADDFNLEEEYGWFLDGILKYVEDNPDEFLAHFGVPGMKWGVRKDRNRAPLIVGLGPSKIVRKTASGEEITLSKDRPNALQQFIAKYSKSYRQEANNSAFLTIHASGKRIGEAQVSERSDDELNLVWLGIDKSKRGKGYATAAMKTAVEFGRESGFKRITLEVPNNSPDARHIYEKLGFKATKELSAAKDDPVWGGLTQMEYAIEPVRHGATIDALLAHYGVPGMKWGVRRDRHANSGPTDVVTTHTPGRRVQAAGGHRQPAHADAVRTAERRQKAKASTIDSLSDHDLKALVNRMNLERQYAQLAAEMTPRSKGQKFVKLVVDMFSVGGKQYGQNLVNSQVQSRMDEFLGVNAKKGRDEKATLDRKAQEAQARRQKYGG